MKLPDNYKGQTFADIAKNIQDKYKDRFDPISQRGLNAELSAVREKQEYEREKKAIQEQLQMTIEQAKNPQMQQQQVSQMQQMQAPMASNQGVVPQIPMEQTQGHQASQSYNEQFRNGGLTDNEGGNPNRFPFIAGQSNLGKIFDNVNGLQVQSKPLHIFKQPQIGLSSFNDPNYNAFGYKGPFTGQTLSQTIPNQDKYLEYPYGTQESTGTYKGVIGSRTPGKVGVNKPKVTDVSATEELARINDARYNDPLVDMSAFDKVQTSQQYLEELGKPLGDGSIVSSTDNNYSPQGINPMRFAPMASNIYNILSARKPTPLNIADYQVQENVGSLPRQTQFSNIDYSQLERGINNQARGFSGANLNASGGNAGSFIANELGNQSNIMNAIGQARMQQQTGNRQTQQMNAQEQARIDAIMQQQAAQRQQAQGINAQLGLQVSDMNARDLGAFNTNRAANIAGLATNIGNLGREQDSMDMIANALGYDSFGNFVENTTPEERKKLLSSIMDGKKKNKTTTTKGKTKTKTKNTDETFQNLMYGN